MKLPAAALALLAALVPFLQRSVDARRADLGGREDMLYLWSGEQVRRLSPGLENVLADVYWLRTVQYFGAQKAFVRQARFELLEPLIDITVALDPRFEIAYRYGAVFLAEPAPAGAGRPQAAIRLLERASRAMPGSWKIRQDLGFIIFFFGNDAQRASDVLLEASKLPGAPYWLRASAADFLRRGGERAASRQVWAHLAEQMDGQMRENALFNLQRLDALDMLDRVQKMVDEFREKAGRHPESFAEVNPAFARGAPADPSGTPFSYDRTTGKVAFETKSYFWRAE